MKKDDLVNETIIADTKRIIGYLEQGARCDQCKYSLLEEEETFTVRILHRKCHVSHVTKFNVNDGGSCSRFEPKITKKCRIHTNLISTIN